jgi:hypothetical protein
MQLISVCRDEECLSRCRMQYSRSSVRDSAGNTLLMQRLMSSKSLKASLINAPSLRLLFYYYRNAF